MKWWAWMVLLGARALWAEEGFWPPASRAGSPLKPEVCVRIMDVDSSGSGGLVSDQGLVLTNRHVVFGQLERLSVDIARRGYRALEAGAEKPCPDLRIYAPGPGPRREYSDITKSWSTYRVYPDVRLVYAPAQGMLVDPWLSLFPRQNMDFDVALLRIYERGEALASPTHLTWQERAPQVGEPVLAGGYPGGTSRWLDPHTRAYMRRTLWPLRRQKWEHRRKLLSQFAQRGESEQLCSQDYRRQARHVVHSLDLTQTYWRSRPLPEPVQHGPAPALWSEPGLSRLVEWAFLLVDHARGDRLFPERDGEQAVGSHLDVDFALEELLLRDALSQSRRHLGARDEYVRLACEGDARHLIWQSQLGDRATRLRLWAHPEAVLRSSDPLLSWARQVYPVILSRQLADRAWWGSLPRLTGPYPDADLSLRLVNGRICQSALANPLVTDCDATGGLSGSPVVDAQGQLLGVLARQSDVLSTQVFRENVRASGVSCLSIAAGLQADGMNWLLEELRR